MSNKLAKITGIVGSVQVVKLFFGLLRNKVLALLFGTYGIGVWGIYQSASDLIQQFAILGLDKSGVKGIASSKNSKKKEDRSNILIFSFMLNAITFSFLILILYLLGIRIPLFSSLELEAYIVCILYSSINMLSIAIVSVFNATRNIKFLAKSQLYSSIVGNILCILTVYLLGSEYIYLGFLFIAVLNLLFAAIFYIKTENKLCFPKFKIFKLIYIKLILDGVGFWLPAVYLLLVEYLIRIMLSEYVNIEMVGAYQASWTISNLYVGIILSAIGVSLYPSLCEIKNKEIDCSSILINDQIKFSLTITLPVLIVIVYYSDIILMLLYSSEFSNYAYIVKIQVYGILMRLIGFPFGYLLMARGHKYKYMISQFLFTTINYLTIKYIITTGSLDDLGLNYAISYTVYLMSIGLFCYKIGFRFKREVVFLILTSLCLIGFVNNINNYVSQVLSDFLVIFILIATCLTALKYVIKKV